MIDHAGVGRATFYRNFCDRKALISALLERVITQLEQKAAHFQQFEDGLFRLIEGHIVITSQARNFARFLESD